MDTNNNPKLPSLEKCLAALESMKFEKDDWFSDIEAKNEAAKAEWARQNPEQANCDHGVKFDYSVASSLSADEVRKLYPRFSGTCPKCGFYGAFYASYEHYICGDW